MPNQSTADLECKALYWKGPNKEYVLVEYRDEPLLVKFQNPRIPLNNKPSPTLQTIVAHNHEELLQ